jgi:serine protease AprX
MLPIRTLVTATLTAVLAAAPVAAQDSPAVAERKIDRALKEALRSGDAGPKRVIVSVKQGYRQVIREALQAHGDAVDSEAPLVNALVAEVHGNDIEELAKHPWVTAVAEDSTVFAGAYRRNDEERARKGLERASRTTKSGSSKVGTSTLRETLGLPEVPSWDTPTGAGVTVAIIDSGIAPSLDLGFRVTAFYDFTRGGIRTSPYDDYGHGTHVAGLIASNGLLSNQVLMGVAPAVKLVGLKVLNGKGEGRTSDVIKAIEFVIANRARLGIDIINMSLGHPIYAPAQDDPLVQAVEAASDAGIVVVTSAGNFGTGRDSGAVGYTGITSPGNAPSALTVGSVDTRNTARRSDDSVALYSSRGPTWFDGFAKPDFVAPGHHLVSNTPLSAYLYDVLEANRRTTSGRDKGSFLELSGTSMASAVATGVAAVVIDANRRANHGAGALSANALKAILEYSSIPLVKEGVLEQGAGSLNALGAMQLAAAIDNRAASGQWWLRTAVAPYSYIARERYQWSQRVIWGDDILTGDLVFVNLPSWSVSAEWGDDNIVWGTNAFLFDDNIVWGTAAEWAKKTVWPDRVIGQMDAFDNILWGFDDNIVWGTLDFDNIVWGTCFDDNIVWGTWELDNIVWGTDDNIVWGTDFDNIVWGTDFDNIVWGTDFDNIVWGTANGVLSVLGGRSQSYGGGR